MPSRLRRIARDHVRSGGVVVSEHVLIRDAGVGVIDPGAPLEQSAATDEDLIEEGVRGQEVDGGGVRVGTGDSDDSPGRRGGRVNTPGQAMANRMTAEVECADV